MKKTMEKIDANRIINLCSSHGRKGRMKKILSQTFHFFHNRRREELLSQGWRSFPLPVSPVKNITGSLQSRTPSALQTSLDGMIDQTEKRVSSLGKTTCSEILSESVTPFPFSHWTKKRFISNMKARKNYSAYMKNVNPLISRIPQRGTLTVCEKRVRRFAPPLTFLEGRKGETPFSVFPTLTSKFYCFPSEKKLGGWRNPLSIRGWLAGDGLTSNDVRGVSLAAPSFLRSTRMLGKKDSAPSLGTAENGLGKPNSVSVMLKHSSLTLKPLAVKRKELKRSLSVPLAEPVEKEKGTGGSARSLSVPGKEKEGVAQPPRKKVERLFLENLPFSITQSVENSRPTLEVRKKRIARNIRLIPSVVRKKRGIRLALRPLIGGARRKGKSFSQSFSLELLESFHGKGVGRETRDAVHKTAEGNRSFLRFRWW
jgi:ribosomal protein S7